MLKKMRQSRPRQGYIVAARCNAQGSRGALQARRMMQGNPQAAGQGQLKVMRVGRRRHEHFRNVGSAYASAKQPGSVLVQRPIKLGTTVQQVAIGRA